MQWFQCQLTMGHVGAGKGEDGTVFIQAPNAVGAYDIARGFPGAKKSRTGSSISVQPWQGWPPEGSRRWYYRRKASRVIAG